MKTTLLLLVAATPLLVSCGAGSIPESEVESDTRKQLGAEKVDCPGDLEAEKGTTMSCTATVAGAERKLRLTVTKVEDGTAVYTVDYDE